MMMFDGPALIDTPPDTGEGTDDPIGTVRTLTVDERDAIPEFKKLLDHLDAKRHGRRFIRRADIQPTEFVPFLPYVFLWDVISADDGRLVDVRVRLQGTVISNLYGEHTGKLWRDYPDPIIAQRAQDAVCDVLVQRSPVARSVSGVTRARHYLDANVLFVPLSEDDTTINRIFGCLIPTDEGRQQLTPSRPRLAAE